EIDAVEERRGSMEEVLAALSAAGVERSELTLAWDFPVATAENVTGRMLALRDGAFESLGDDAPAFAIDEVQTTDLKPGIARLVRGTMQVPSFLTGDGGPGSRLNYGADGETPAPSGGTLEAPFS